MNLTITELLWFDEDTKLLVSYSNGGEDELTLEYVTEKTLLKKLNKAFNKTEIPCVYDDGIYLNYLFVYKSHLYIVSVDESGNAMWYKVVEIKQVKNRSVSEDCVEQVN